MVQYTYDWYQNFIQELDHSGYEFHKFNSFDRDNSQAVIIRHDVDWSPQAAAKIAEIESECDVNSTYFFLVTSPFYNLLSESVRGLIRQIESLGHNIGLHFSVHQYWNNKRPPDEELTAAIKREQSVLQTVVDNLANQVAFHNPPEWIIDEEFDQFSSTYEPQFISSADYVADSLYRWKDDSPKPESFGDRVQILTHPALWGSEAATPQERIQQVQRDYVEKTDQYMNDRSRLKWTNTAEVFNEEY